MVIVASTYEVYLQLLAAEKAKREGKTVEAKASLRQDDIDLTQVNAPATPSKYEMDRTTYLKKKYSMDGLSVVGIPDKNEIAQAERTVADSRKERERLEGLKYSTASVNYKGKNVDMPYIVTIS